MPAPEARRAPAIPTADVVRRLVGGALESDYRRAGGRRVTRRSPSPLLRVASLAALLAAGLLIATAAVQAKAGAGAAAAERAELVTQINERKAEIRAQTSQLATLRTDVVALQGSIDLTSQRNRDLLVTLGRDRILTGATQVTGPGVRILLDDNPRSRPGGDGTVLDVDLQVLVNGLWRAGAEAVAINGSRLGPLSAIRTAGSAITVNYQSLSRPYLVTAIGNPATLPGRFANTPAGQVLSDLHTNFGVRFELTASDQLTLPAAPAPRLHLRYAQRQGQLP